MPNTVVFHLISERRLLLLLYADAIFSEVRVHSQAMFVQTPCTSTAAVSIIGTYFQAFDNGQYVTLIFAINVTYSGSVFLTEKYIPMYIAFGPRPLVSC